ncbi:MAG: YidC/Oxa1 family membrane protein insertase [Patescibacteria group bacterium]|nr:YidC/Oxa1 family membrane protein insertase [Patescibacteria group bacterium]
MNNSANINAGFFNTIFVIPILNILLILYSFFSFLKFPGALGFSIIGLTFLVNFLLLPINKKQRAMTEKLNELKPHLDKLQKKYKNDQAKLQSEQLKLYQQAGVNPGLGCLLPFIQLPFFIALYSVLSLFLLEHKGVNIFENINKAVYFSFLKINSIDTSFFGFNLALSPQKSGIWYYLLIPIITGLLQYIQINLITPKAKIEKEENQKKQEKDKEKNNQEDIQKMMNIQMKFLMPAFIAWFAYTLPVGLALYWNVYSLFNIIQYRKPVNLKKN